MKPIYWILTLLMLATTPATFAESEMLTPEAPVTETAPVPVVPVEPVGEQPPPAQPTEPLLETQGVTPAIGGQVTSLEVVDRQSSGFVERVRSDVAKRPAPEPGMTRAAVEAVWGPDQSSFYNPGAGKAVYVNNYELIDGRLIPRKLSQKSIKVYEVTYTEADNPRASSNEQQVVSVQPVMRPRIGDHTNMYTLLLENPIDRDVEQNRHLYAIPEPRLNAYWQLIDNPYDLIMVHTNADNRVIAQEFYPGRWTWSHNTFTSANRYIQNPVSFYTDPSQPFQ
jgi:hypothetical protein